MTKPRHAIGTIDARTTTRVSGQPNGILDQPTRPNPHWIMSIIVSIVFFPVGLVALLFSFLSNDGFEKGNVVDARRYSRYARNCAIGLVAQKRRCLPWSWSGSSLSHIRSSVTTTRSISRSHRQPVRSAHLEL